MRARLHGEEFEEPVALPLSPFPNAGCEGDALRAGGRAVSPHSPGVTCGSPGIPGANLDASICQRRGSAASRGHHCASGLLRASAGAPFRYDCAR